MGYHNLTTEELVDRWHSGKLDPNNAESVTFEDETVKVQFYSKSGPVILCFDLETGFKTNPEGNFEEFDPYR